MIPARPGIPAPPAEVRPSLIDAPDQPAQRPDPPCPPVLPPPAKRFALDQPGLERIEIMVGRTDHRPELAVPLHDRPFCHPDHRELPRPAARSGYRWRSVPACTNVFRPGAGTAPRAMSKFCSSRCRPSRKPRVTERIQRHGQRSNIASRIISALLPTWSRQLPIAGRHHSHGGRPEQIHAAHVDHVDPQVRPVAADHRPVRYSGPTHHSGKASSARAAMPRTEWVRVRWPNRRSSGTGRTRTAGRFSRG